MTEQELLEICKECNVCFDPNCRLPVDVIRKKDFPELNCDVFSVEAASLNFNNLDDLKKALKNIPFLWVYDIVKDDEQCKLRFFEVTFKDYEHFKSHCKDRWKDIK